MYKQFAITIAISVFISGFVALTLTPALCVLILKPAHKPPVKPLRIFNEAFSRVTQGYIKGVNFFMARTGLGLGIFVAMLVAIGLLFIVIPTSLVPEEDQGYVFTASSLLPGASLSRTDAVMRDLTDFLKAQPEVENVVAFAGLDFESFSQRSNKGGAFVSFKPWKERSEPQSSSKALVGRINMGMMAKNKDAMVFALIPPPITGISLTGGFEAYVQNRAGDTTKLLADMTQKFMEAAKQRKELIGMRSTFDANVPQYYVRLDHVKAKALNVPIASVFNVMQSTFGSFYVNDFTLNGRSFRVSLQSEGEFREKPEDLEQVFVRSTTGKMIPLSSLLNVERTIGPDLIDRYNIFPAAKLLGGPAPGYSSGQALKAMEEVASEVLPKDYDLSWTGSAYQEKLTGSSSLIAFCFGLIMVFLILAAQYERWNLPFAVIIAVPFAVFGALLAIWLRGISNDVYFQVGLLTLIGLGAKNAILIVEFASMLRHEGWSFKEAAVEAARLRFRPIVMTSLAFILGCVPLAISTGAGAGSRHSIGTGVIGGMLAATLIATFFIPMFYNFISQIGGSDKLKVGPKENLHV